MGTETFIQLKGMEERGDYTGTSSSIIKASRSRIFCFCDIRRVTASHFSGYKGKSQSFDSRRYTEEAYRCYDYVRILCLMQKSLV
jgi:hypothetical protein